MTWTKIKANIPDGYRISTDMSEFTSIKWVPGHSKLPGYRINIWSKLPKYRIKICILSQYFIYSFDWKVACSDFCCTNVLNVRFKHMCKTIQLHLKLEWAHQYLISK